MGFRNLGPQITPSGIGILKTFCAFSRAHGRRFCRIFRGCLCLSLGHLFVWEKPKKNKKTWEVWMRGFNEFECEPSEVHKNLCSAISFLNPKKTAWGALDQFFLGWLIFIILSAHKVTSTNCGIGVMSFFNTCWESHLPTKNCNLQGAGSQLCWTNGGKMLQVNEFPWAQKANGRICSTHAWVTVLSMITMSDSLHQFTRCPLA